MIKAAIIAEKKIITCVIKAASIAKKKKIITRVSRLGFFFCDNGCLYHPMKHQIYRGYSMLFDEYEIYFTSETGFL
jgi:hypothetical protein